MMFDKPRVFLHFATASCALLGDGRRIDFPLTFECLAGRNTTQESREINAVHIFVGKIGGIIGNAYFVANAQNIAKSHLRPRHTPPASSRQLDI